MVKVLKEKIGYVFINGQKYDVFKDHWEKTAKSGQKYYENKQPVFVQEIQKQEQKDQTLSA